MILILNRCMNLRLISYKTNKMTKGSFMYAEKIEYDDIEMSSRLRNILGRNGFESLEGLREYPKEHFIKFRNMGQATLQELYQICEEQGIKLRSVEDLNDREHGVRFDDFLCMDAFRMGIKSKWHGTMEGTTMKYEGYKIGPVIRDIRKDKGLLIEEVAAKTGISVSTLGQVEQGGRNLSMKNLYMLMEVYETDANSLLAIDCTPDSLDSRLKRLPADKQDYLEKTFDFMIEQALKSA